MSGRPVNLWGEWSDGTAQDGYARYFAGNGRTQAPIEVRYHPEDEPDGELVARGVAVHLERMSRVSWSLILTTPDGHDVAVRLRSKKPIHVEWSDEP